MFKNFKILRPILLALIIGIPLYPKFPLSSITGTFVSIRVDDYLVLFSVIVYGFYQLIHGFPVFKHKITKLFIVYFFAIFVSTVVAILIYQTTDPKFLLLNLFRRFEYMSLFFITIDTIKSLSDIKISYITAIFATILVSVYGLGQKFLGWPIVSTMNSEFAKGQLLVMSDWTRISSSFAGHYDLAAYLSAILVVIGIVAIIQKNLFLKFLNLIFWLLGFYILTLTASRISTFAFWGGMVLTLVLVKKYFWIVPVSAIMIFSIFTSVDLNQRLLATIPGLKKSLSYLKLPSRQIITPTTTPIPTYPPIAIITGSPLKPKPKGTSAPTPVPTVMVYKTIEEFPPVDADVGVARSGEIRFNAEWPRAITAFKRNPLVGSGLGSITLATDNDYLRTLGESGILGFVTFFSIIFYFIQKTIPLLFRKKLTHLEILQITFLGALLVTLANAVFIDVFEASKTAYLFWIMMGIYYQTIAYNQRQK
jgi:hypothetical protein